jgi:hypothetical protein
MGNVLEWEEDKSFTPVPKGFTRIRQISQQNMAAG